MSMNVYISPFVSPLNKDNQEVTVTVPFSRRRPFNRWRDIHISCTIHSPGYRHFIINQAKELRSKCKNIINAQLSKLNSERKVNSLRNCIRNVQNFQTRLTQINLKSAKAKIILRKIILIAAPIVLLLIGVASFIGGIAGLIVMHLQRLDNYYKCLKVVRIVLSIIVPLELLGLLIAIICAEYSLIIMCVVYFCNISKWKYCSPYHRRWYSHSWDYNLRRYCYSYEINKDLAVFDPNYLENTVIRTLRAKKRESKNGIDAGQRIIDTNLQEIERQKREFSVLCEDRCGVKINTVVFENVPGIPKTGPHYTG